MPKAKLDPVLLELCAKVAGKRPRTVIDQILKHGFVSTEDLQNLGYDHPPRAAMDVRDNGVPLETFKVKSTRTGRMITAYRFGDPSKIKGGRIGGRTAFSKSFRDILLTHYGSSDTITGTKMEARYLQIDHRIPYQVSGDEQKDKFDVADFMLLDASSQRSKSWSCEHCENFVTQGDPEICRGCYWAFPEDYSHIAMEPIRRVDIVWVGDEVVQYEILKSEAERRGLTVSDLMKLRTS